MPVLVFMVFRHFHRIDEAGLERLAVPARRELQRMHAVRPVEFCFFVDPLVIVAIGIKALHEEAAPFRLEGEGIGRMSRAVRDVGGRNPRELHARHVGAQADVKRIRLRRHGEAADAADGKFHLVVADKEPGRIKENA